MTCYEIARKIMDKIVESTGLTMADWTQYRSVRYYNDSRGSEYFCLKHGGVEILVFRGNITKIEIKNPRGIILFNLRLWLLETYKLVK